MHEAAGVSLAKVLRVAQMPFVAEYISGSSFANTDFEIFTGSRGRVQWGGALGGPLQYYSRAA